MDDKLLIFGEMPKEVPHTVSGICQLLGSLVASVYSHYGASSPKKIKFSAYRSGRIFTVETSPGYIFIAHHPQDNSHERME